MTKRRAISLSIIAIVGTGAALLPAVGRDATAAPTVSSSEHSCTTTPPVGYATCDEIRRNDVAGPLARPNVAVANVAGFGPTAIRSA